MNFSESAIGVQSSNDQDGIEDLKQDLNELKKTTSPISSPKQVTIPT